MDTHDPGIVILQGKHSVDETVARIRALLEQRHIMLFALVDHSGEAAKAGLTMPPTKLLIFGNPKAGTPVMLAAPTAALDLPLKLLVWQGEEGGTHLAYNDLTHLQSRHNIPEELMQNLQAVATLAEQASE